MAKIICVKCQVEFKMVKSGVKIAEMFQKNKKIYKIWNADKWQCPKCKVEIVYGFADHPLMEHFQGDLDKFLSELEERGNEVIRDNEF